MAERTLSAKAESRVKYWTEAMTEGMESSLEFGAGLFAYVKASKALRRAGIEAFKPYCDRALEDPEINGISVYQGDMRYFEPFMAEKPYHVALFIDSLEHLGKEDALDLMLRCQEQFGRIAVFIPMGVHVQGPCDDNELQSHLSSWSPKEFLDLGFSVKPHPTFHWDRPVGNQGAIFAKWDRAEEWR